MATHTVGVGVPTIVDVTLGTSERLARVALWLGKPLEELSLCVLTVSCR
ncbi:hypothetical protein OB955_25010 [Halobacteria archaeon AArc-m2/3/4]|uniref:Uncharacterized protein n=1 Tax=Natronoglomus mannanivorans TaxID=2979990 RepID=A0ABT2QLX4_9EURY|nr:hypothetical protein [Halobacteria archaeon AArc-m2/3/4]